MRSYRRLALPLALAAALLVACGGEGGSAPSGVTTATPARTPTTEATPTTLPAATSAAPTSTSTPAPPPTAEPTAGEVELAALAGEDASVIAGALVFLDGRCSDDREALGRYAGQTWRILNEQRGVRAPVLAILNRVIFALPIDGRTVACESLFASVVTELARQ